MRKSIITTLVISIVCLLVGGVLIGVSVYQMTNPFTYSYDFAEGFFSYSMKYASNLATNSVYYQCMFQIGQVLLISAAILGGATLIAYVINTRKGKDRKADRPRPAEAKPIDIPVMEETVRTEEVKPEEN